LEETGLIVKAGEVLVVLDRIIPAETALCNITTS